ncbi:MAG TPA: serine/threonine-protein kinase [Albitalea sp.]|nr:serine/threonine-protein kinase [Albitalea sp.]
MDLPDRAQWQRLSPLLDELLELDEPARAARLARLRGDDAPLADELRAMLDDARAAQHAQFLSGQAVPPPTLADADEPTLAGQRIGAYLLEAPLGHGGTGSVWRARRADGRFEGEVAVKLLHASLVGRIGARRFEREGEILARLTHPHIARLLDAGVTAGGQPYLVIELVQGERIDRYCDEHHLNVEQRLALFAEVLAAVAHAHSRGAIHRDIKPSNIMVSRDGSVKLLDFGIAKLLDTPPDGDITGEGARALTPEYAAPEQVRGGEVSTATDVYALGVLLYQLLAGRHPTAPERGDYAQVLRATLDTDPLRLPLALTSPSPDPGVPQRIASQRDTPLPRLRRQLEGDLENIVARALRKQPSQRYPTVDAFADDLRRYLAHEPVSARADSVGYRARKFVARHRGLVAGSALVALAIVAGLSGTISQARRAQAQSRVAAEEAEAARRERDEALSQQRLLRGTNEFLTLLMRDAAHGDPGAIRRQLDRASELLEHTRFEHPIVKVALLRQTAGRYEELGDLGAAMARLREAIAAVEGTELALPSSGVPVNLACSLARALDDAGRPLEARAELDRADALMAAGAALSVPSRVECRMHRSFVESDLGHLDAAVAMVEDALATLERSGVTQGEQHRVLRSAVARALMLAGRHAQALAIAAPLLAESMAGQGRESMAVVRRSSMVTALTRLGGRPLAAVPLSQADEASAATLLGPGRHDGGIDMEHGLVLLALAQPAPASELLLRSAAQAEAAGAAGEALQARLAATEALLQAGRTQQALQAWQRVERERLAAAEPGALLGVERLRVAALVARARGDSTTARQALAQARAAVDAGGGEAHPGAFALALAQADFALAEGDAATAAAEAERALGAARRLSLDPRQSSLVGRALLARARAHAAAHDPHSARADAAEAAAQLAATLGTAHPLARQAAALAR